MPGSTWLCDKSMHSQAHPPEEDFWEGKSHTLLCSGQLPGGTSLEVEAGPRRP